MYGITKVKTIRRIQATHINFHLEKIDGEGFISYLSSSGPTLYRKKSLPKFALIWPHFEGGQFLPSERPNYPIRRQDQNLVKVNINQPTEVLVPRLRYFTYRYFFICPIEWDPVTERNITRNASKWPPKSRWPPKLIFHCLLTSDLRLLEITH